MFQVGQSLGDYAILNELGKGGYGYVYKVEHTITGRREALKVLVATNTGAAEQSERFLREIRLQASLSHPNIAVVHTAFWVNDDLALVCELLEGESLQLRLERGTVSQKHALEIMAQVLDALSYAHARGIIHRDISPSNIFLTAAGTVKIIDFGLAKAATDLRLTREGSPVGVAHYMSPEQIRGTQDIDARTDVYSCGVVLYELLVGKKPFDGDSAFTIMKAQTEELPPSPTGTNSQLAPALSVIVLRALAKKPEVRFQSADAFLQAIKDIKVESAVAIPRRALRRYVLIAACATCAILIGVLAVSLTTRAGNAQFENNRPFIVPPPPAVVEVAPLVEPAAKVAAKKRHRKQAPRAVAAVVAEQERAGTELLEAVQPASTSTNASVSVPTEAKPRNSVLKVLKRINPFQQTSPAPKDNAKN